MRKHTLPKPYGLGAYYQSVKGLFSKNSDPELTKSAMNAVLNIAISQLAGYFTVRQLRVAATHSMRVLCLKDRTQNWNVDSSCRSEVFPIVFQLFPILY
jgi:hypothetical protein